MKVPKFSRYEWFVMCDPGTAISPFAVLFIALDRYTPMVYLVDEIYETDPEDTTAGSICPRIKEKCALYTNDHTDWKLYYDIAAAWFKVAASKEPHKLIFSPVEKRAGDKEDGIDNIQEAFLQNKILISTNCPNTIWEIDNYFKDKKGNFVKKNDNQIDNLRYFFKMARVTIVPSNRPDDPTVRRKARSRNHSVDGIKAKLDKFKWQKKVMKHYE